MAARPYLVLARDGLHASQSPAEQARHVHLRDAETAADLGLAQVLLEAQANEVAFALGQRAQRAAEERRLLGGVEAAVDRAGGAPAVALVTGLGWGVERFDAVREARLH